MDSFTFAGFAFPRPVAMFHYGYGAKAVRKRAELAKVCGPYTHAPRPIEGAHPGASFYLESDFMPGLRWQWADEIAPRSIRHRGWYTDEHGDGDTIRGLVMRLPHARGFLAGWSMGEGMASAIEGEIYPDEIGAALAADSIAERTAETEREYQSAQEADE